jgi:hypothetical protein
MKGMFDPGSFMVGGVALIAVVFGLVEFLKEALGWEGKRVTVLAAVLGAVLMGLYQLQSVLPAPFSQVYEIVVISLTFGLSASGYYKFASSRMPKRA